MSSADSIVERSFSPEVAATHSGPLWHPGLPVVEDDEKGRIVTRGGMWKHQSQWWDLDNFIKVLVGGYGSGKTNIGAKRSIALALHNAPAPHATVSPTFPIAKETIIISLIEQLQGKQALLGRGFKWRVKRSSPYEFTIWWKGRKGRILCYSGEDPLALRGPNIGSALIDEPFIQHVDVFKQIMARVRHPQARRREIGLTGTPEQLNWGYDLCMGDMEDDYDVAYVQANTRDNLALPEEYFTRLARAYSDKEAAAFLSGMFINLAQGLVFHAFQPQLSKTAMLPPDIAPDTPVKCFTLPSGETVAVPEAAEMGAGMDFNVDPMSWTIFWHMGNRIHFIDEMEMPNSDTEEACAEIRNRYGRFLNTIYPDPAGKARSTASPGGKTDFHYIKQAGFNIEAPTDHYIRRDSFNAVNGKFKAKVGPPTLTIASRCVKLIKYMQTYSHELMNKQKSMSHLLDSFRYPITRLFPILRETPQVRKLTGA